MGGAVLLGVGDAISSVHAQDELAGSNDLGLFLWRQEMERRLPKGMEESLRFLFQPHVAASGKVPGRHVAGAAASYCLRHNSAPLQDAGWTRDSLWPHAAL